MSDVLVRLCGIYLLFALMNGASPAPRTTDRCDPTGRWLSAENKALTIEMSSVDGKWSGKVLRSSDPDVPVGFLMMRGFIYNAKDQKFKGKIARPSGREVSADMTCKEDGTLEVSGGVAFMKKTIVWRREDSGR